MCPSTVTGVTSDPDERRAAFSGGKPADAEPWWRELRKRNVWGSSISVELLEESSLLVCKVISRELQEEINAEGATLAGKVPPHGRNEAAYVEACDFGGTKRVIDIER